MVEAKDIMNILVFCLTIGAAVSQHIVNQEEFPNTQELIFDLGGVIGESSSLQTCIKKVERPLDKTIDFVKDVQGIDEKVTKIQERIETTVAIMTAVQYIPYVGQVAAVVLNPVIYVLNMINTGLTKVEPIVSKFADTLARWEEPLQKVKSKVDWVTTVIGKFTSVVAMVDAKATAAEACADELPLGRSEAIRTLEHVSNSLDIIPDGFNNALGHVNKGCLKVEKFLSKIHAVRRRRGLPSLHIVQRVLDNILKAFGPLGHFLDEVDKVLHKKFCLLHSLEDLAKGVIKGAEHLGKEVIHGAEHLVDEAGHVWAEVKDGVEHLGHEIGKGAEHLAHEVGKGVEHAGKEIAKGAEHVAHEVGKGAEHVAHEVAKGAEHVAHEVGKGVHHVGHEISKGVHHVGHVLHHIFGRRGLESSFYRENVPEAIYFIDGHLYALVDGSFNARSRRGFDVCLRISDILKGVNFVTGGLMNKAQSLISKLFHGKSPFHIPGLTSDVLNIGSLFHNFDLGAILPSIEDFLKLPELDIKKFLALDRKLFEKMVPDCKTAFAKVDLNMK